MTTLDFSIKLGANPNNLFSLITNYKNLPRFLPDQLKNVDILEEDGNRVISEETLVFSSLIKKTIIQKTEHKILGENNLESKILSGPAKNSKINVLLEKDGDSRFVINNDKNCNNKCYKRAVNLENGGEILILSSS